MSPRPWPNPSDSALDRARAIARSMASALAVADPPRHRALVDAAMEFGETWLEPLADMSGEFLSTEDAARLVGVRETTIRTWGHRSHIPVHRYPDGWSKQELLAYRASQRRDRARG